MFTETYAFLKYKGVMESFAHLGEAPQGKLYYLELFDSMNATQSSSVRRGLAIMIKLELVKRFHTLNNTDTLQLTPKGRKIYAKLKDIQAIMEAN